MKFFFFAIATATLVSCGTPMIQSTSFKADQVIARSDDVSIRPEWVRETKSVFDDGANWIIVGMVEVPGDSRVPAAFKMSDANTRGNLANKLETSVLKIVEASDSGLSMDDQNLKSLIKEVSQSTFKNIDIDERYWEKVVRTNSNGGENLVLKAFSRLKISKADFVKVSAAQIEKSKVAPSDIKTKIESLIEKNLEAQFSKAE